MAFAAAGASAFARLGEFVSRLRLLTPWGKDELAQGLFLDDRADIESRLDDVDAALSWIKAAGNASGAARLDRVSYHLGRMPRIPIGPKDAYDSIELFQLKKFLYNLRALAEGLGAEARSRFGVAAPADGSHEGALASALALGGSDPEAFRIADAHDPRLSSLRAAIAEADRELSAERLSAESEAEARYGVRFDGRDFVVVEAEAASRMSAGPTEAGWRFAVEPYDRGRRIVRAEPGPAAVDAMVRREALREDERIAEADAVSRLSALASEALPGLLASARAVARWDRALAAARLALELGLSRPKLDSRAFAADEARLTPLEDECSRLGLRYEPLSARFEGGAAVVFGSNMGGKTIVLKTALFLQLLAQAGLFVPAKAFSTRVYGRVEYVGEGSGESLEGLSGFGVEMTRLIGAMDPSGGALGDGPSGVSSGGWRPGGETRGQAGGGTGGALVAYDELCRTTGSAEAEALLSAVLEAYAGGSRGLALFATHYRGVARLPGVQYLRMLGLDRESALAARPEARRPGAAGGAASGPGDASRLAEINRHMRYGLVDDDGQGGSDALAIASYLGLDPAIIDRAERFLEGRG